LKEAVEIKLPENRRLTHNNKIKKQKEQVVELKSMKGYLLKKSPRFFGGWQVLLFR
jgi:hypothetical protein